MRLGLIALLVVGGTIAPAASADTLTREQKHQCQFNSMSKMEWTEREEARTTWCVLDRWPVPGGISKFRAVGDCESHWYRFAHNGDDYLGLFQHSASAWKYRVRSYEPFWWDLKPGWMNSRTQIVVTARMVRAQGWGPWSCA